MNFSELRKASEAIQATKGLYEKEAIIRYVLMRCKPDERMPAAMMLTGKLSTAQEGLTTGIKESFIAKDLALEGRQSLESIADVAMARAEIFGRPISVLQVWNALRAYLTASDRTHATKSKLIDHALFALPETEADIPFLLQILCEKVSNGVGDIMVVQALFDGEDRDQVSRAFSLNPNLPFWVSARYDEEFQLGDVTVTPGVPLDPQLCARVRDLAEILDAHKGSTIMQPKLDGMRVHIHCWDADAAPEPQVRIFSRKLLDITEEYPEIAAAALELRRMCVLDGELVALGPDGEVAPFALLQTRLGRKTGRDAVKVGVALYDLLHLGEASTLQVPYDARLEVLEKLVRGNDRLRVIESTRCNDLETLRYAVAQAHEDGEEGIVCKDPNGLPEPGARSKSWIKCKPDYLGGDFSDTFDLVVIGFNRGRGRRHGKVGALWVGIRDQEALAIRPVCKVGTGFKDEDLDWWTENLEARADPPGIVEYGTRSQMPEIDFWVDPVHVIEVGATGGLTKIDKWAGFSLRFPRYIRRRDDKTPAQATSTSEVNLP